MLMTLNHTSIYFLYSMVFSVTIILFRPGCVLVDFQFNVSKSVVMLIGTRQKINHCDATAHISG